VTGQFLQIQYRSRPSIDKQNGRVESNNLLVIIKGIKKEVGRKWYQSLVLVLQRQRLYVGTELKTARN
jgi:hypothetical protein